MKIYTKTGDQGETGLWGGQRVPKDSLRVTAYGTVDELNAMLGVTRASEIEASIDQLLERIQNELFDLGADLATPGDSTRIPRIGMSHITLLEQEIDQFETELQPLRQFILPGGTFAAANLHFARTICRRAERTVLSLMKQEPTSEATLRYLNRLSDWLFVLARLANARAGLPDVPWKKRA